MTTAIKRRRGTTTQHSTFTGLEGEITVDSTKDTVVVHDGATAGGYPLLREDLSNNTNVITATNTKTLTNKTVDLASNTLTGTTAQFNAALSDNDFATLTGTETLSNKTFSTNPTVSSGTANGVAYLNGSKVLTTGSALTFDGGANLSTGGSNASTYNTLNVNNTASNGYSRLLLNIGASGANGVGVIKYAPGIFFGIGTESDASSTPITFFLNGSEQMRLTSTGLGIGTSSPGTYNAQFVNYKSTGSFTYLGHSNGTGTFPKVSAIGFGSDAVGYTYTSSGSSVALYGSAQIAAIQSSSSNATTDLAFYTTSGGSVAERMRIDSSGNVGIGTSNPFGPLDVKVAADSRCTIYSLSGIPAITGYTDAGASKEFRVTGFPLTFSGNGAAGAEQMRIDSSGNLLVGTTSNPNACLAVFQRASSASNVDFRTTATAATNQCVFTNGNGVVGTITTNGTSTTYVTTSDYRLKENIQPMQNALDVVAQLNPVRYTWKADGSDGQGFIAHELQAVVPDCVTGEKDAVDAEGKPIYQGIDTSFLVATLTKAIQELKAELDATKAEVAALKGV